VFCHCIFVSFHVILNNTVAISGRAWLCSTECVFACNSDDRSADVFREKIESATQMKAVLGADPRPNCLIIDEIDGAPQVSLSL